MSLRPQLRVLVVLVVLALVLGLPAAQAAKTYTYTSGRWQQYTDPEPISDTYTITYANPFLRYETGDGSIVFGAVESVADMGTVGYSWIGGGDVVSYTVMAEFSNNTTSQTVRFENIVNCGRGGYCDTVQDVYLLNNTTAAPVWDHLWRELQSDLSPWSGYHYISSSIVAYANDSRGYTDREYRDCGSGGRCTIEPSPDSLTRIEGGTLWWVRPHQGEDVFNDFSTTNGYGFVTNGYAFHYLANLSGLVNVQIDTHYHNRLPDSFSLKTAWYTQAIKEAHADADECDGIGSFKSLIRNVIGFCPTIDQVVTKMVDLATLPFALIMLIVPNGDGFLEGLRAIASEIIGAYILTLALILVAPAKFIVVSLVLVTGFSLCFAGIRRDPVLVAQGIKHGIVGTGLFVFWLFAALFYITRWSWEAAQWAIQTSIAALRG